MERIPISGNLYEHHLVQWTDKERPCYGVLIFSKETFNVSFGTDGNTYRMKTFAVEKALENLEQ